MATEIPSTLITGDVDEAIRAFSRLQDLFDYWQKLRGNRDMPSRSDFNPIDIPHLLEYLWLADVIDDGKDFALRVVGNEVEEVTGRLMSMKRISELPDDDATRAIRENLEHCREAKLPVFQSGRLREPHKDFLAFASITLPLSQDRTHVDSILSVMEFIDAN